MIILNRIHFNFSLHWLFLPIQSALWQSKSECVEMWRKNFVVCNHPSLPHISLWSCFYYDDNIYYCGFIIWKAACYMFTFNSHPKILALFDNNTIFFYYYDYSSFLSLSIRCVTNIRSGLQTKHFLLSGLCPVTGLFPYQTGLFIKPKFSWMLKIYAFIW